jgi:hypothetical protein
MCTSRSLGRFVLVLGVVVLAGSAAHAEYVCQAMELEIGTPANNPFTAELLVPMSRPDGSPAHPLDVHIARDSAGRVAVRTPEVWTAGKSTDNTSTRWKTTICDPQAKTVTELKLVEAYLEGSIPAESPTYCIGEKPRIFCADGTAQIFRGDATPGLYRLRRQTLQLNREAMQSSGPAGFMTDLGIQNIQGASAHGYRRSGREAGRFRDDGFPKTWMPTFS